MLAANRAVNTRMCSGWEVAKMTIPLKTQAAVGQHTTKAGEVSGGSGVADPSSGPATPAPIGCRLPELVDGQDVFL